MIYCGVASNSKDQPNDDNNSNDDDDTAEVFFGVDDARLISKLSFYFFEGDHHLI